MKKISKIITLILAATMLFAFPTVGTAAPSRYKPVVILKFDDLTAKNVPGFQKVFDILTEENIKGGFGVIGKSLEDGDGAQDFYSKIKTWHDAGVEIWHHGYSHTEPEYHGSDYDTQFDSFNKTVSLLKDKCGITVTSFGSPYNNSDATTIKMINEKFPQITNIMLAADPNKEAKAVLLPTRCNIEPSTGVVNYDQFMINYDKLKLSPYIVLQGHPAGWKDNDISEFKKIIAFLKKKGSTFMAPSEYAEYYKKQLENPDTTDYIDVMLNGSYVEFDDAEPIMLNDRVMVPFRKIFGALDAGIEWDESTNTATATKADKIIKITENSKTAYINDAPVELDTAATIIDDRFVVPIRFVAEALDQIVYWDDKTTSVIIASKSPNATDALPDGAIAIKGCTFSSFFEDELGCFTYDGTADTLWSCDGTSEWICYDLGEKTDVRKVSIMWNKGDARKAKFKIEISDDAQSFTALFEGESSGTHAEFEDYSVTGSGRYVRIFCMGNSASNWNAIKEIVFYK